jgi:hypothetical protein
LSYYQYSISNFKPQTTSQKSYFIALSFSLSPSLPLLERERVERVGYSLIEYAHASRERAEACSCCRRGERVLLRRYCKHEIFRIIQELE